MKLSTRALSLLRCPRCDAPLSQSNDRFACAGPACGQSYPIISEAPVLFDESSSLLSFADVEAGAMFLSAQASWLARCKQRLLRLQPDLRCNRKAAGNYLALSALLLGKEQRPLVLVIGGKELGAGLSSLLAHSTIELLESDILPGPRVGLICDAHVLPLASASVDGVIIQAVLDDLVDPQRCIAEIFRVLKPNGLVYAETPFLQAMHDAPFDFTRFTRSGHRRLFRRFEEVDSGAVGGPAQALAGIYHAFLLSLVRRPMARSVASLVARWTAFWLKYVDGWLLDRDRTACAASGYYFMGRKSDEILSDRELIAAYATGSVWLPHMIAR